MAPKLTGSQAEKESDMEFYQQKLRMYRQLGVELNQARNTAASIKRLEQTAADPWTDALDTCIAALSNEYDQVCEEIDGLLAMIEEEE